MQGDGEVASSGRHPRECERHCDKPSSADVRRLKHRSSGARNPRRHALALSLKNLLGGNDKMTKADLSLALFVRTIETKSRVLDAVLDA